MSREANRTIWLTPETRDRLRARKVGGETYEDVLTRLLDSTEPLVDTDRLGRSA